VFTAIAWAGDTRWGEGQDTSKKAAEAVAAEAAVRAISEAHPHYTRRS
jgi:ribonuclease-3